MRRRIAFVLAALLCIGQGTPHAATMTLAPAPYQTVLDQSGQIISGACVWTYVAGTSTGATTYTDKLGAVPNPNPIVTNGSGQFTAYLVPGSSYKFVYENIPCSGPPNPTVHGAVLGTYDNIDGVPASASAVDVVGTAGETLSAGNAVYLSDGSGGKSAGQWYKADTTNAYSSIQPEIGYALAAITSSTTGSIRLAGQITGLAGLTIGADYYLSTTGSITTTAPTTRRWAGRADSTTTLVLGQPPIGPATATITTTGTQTALALPTGQGDAVIFANNATLLTIQGIAAGFDGQRLSIYSIGAGQIDTVNQSGAAGAALRLINTATSGNTSAAAGAGMFLYQYDATVARWRLLLHEQGGWITRTFAAGSFTANGAMTWTVTSGQTTRDSYYLKGRTLSYGITVVASTAGGVASTALQVLVPGGFTTATAVQRGPIAITNNGVGSIGMVSAASGATVLQTFLDTVGATNWTLSANTSVEGVFQFEIQD